MRPILDEKALSSIVYLVGNIDILSELPNLPALRPFSEEACSFLNEVSRLLRHDDRSKDYPELLTLAFWLRSGSTLNLADRFSSREGVARLGRGVSFHVAPSNVPVNFAYSLASGLLAGNANIVRVPSREFPQISIISDAIKSALALHSDMKPYIVLVRYPRSRGINDALSLISDARVVWGGDNTIAELRKSPLPPRSVDIAFADRRSLAIIDPEAYLVEGNFQHVAHAFYNDTYLTDQAACTSPKLVVWLEGPRDKAKEVFWDELYRLVQSRYDFQSIQAVRKLEQSCLAAVAEPNSRIIRLSDELLIRINVLQVSTNLLDYELDGGIFLEYDCNDLSELMPYLDDKRCQTIGLLGKSEIANGILNLRPAGVDRIVPLGATMDFDLVWDGYDLVSQLSREIDISSFEGYRGTTR